MNFNTEKVRKFVFYKKLRQHVGKLIRISGTCYFRESTEYQVVHDELALLLNTDKKDTDLQHDLYQVDETASGAADATIVFRGNLMQAWLVDSQVEFVND